MVVALPLVGVAGCLGVSARMHVVFQSFAIRAMFDPQPNLFALATYRTNHGGTITLIRAVFSLFVGSPTRRVITLDPIVKTTIREK